MSHNMKVFLDWESFYSTKEKYDLKHISMTEYIRSPRFKAFGCGIAINDDPVQWLSYDNLSAFDYIDWSTVTLVGHNVKFDGSILLWRYGFFPKAFIDTKGMSRAVLGKSIKNHSLRTLAEHFGLESKGQLLTDGKVILTESEEKALADYCIHDVELCREIYSRLAKEFPQNQYPIMDQTIKMFVDPKLVLNVPLLEKTAIDEAERRKNIFRDITIDLKAAYPDRLSLYDTWKNNPEKCAEMKKSIFASNVKFPKLLENEGYEVPMKDSPRKIQEDGLTPVRIPALALGDPDFLEMLEGEDERLKTLCEARVAAKSTLLETRSSKLAKIGTTGKWPFDVEFSGADQTHRFSGGSGAGGNPQNFTRGSALRSSIGTPEGFELIVGDFSNIELRLVAYLSRDPGLIEAIEKGKDIYCDFASAFYGRTITKADKKERQFGKTAILGLGYGMGFVKFIKTVRTQTGEVITEETSRKAVELYRTRYNRVPELWETYNSNIIYLANHLSHNKGSFLEIQFESIILPSGLKIRFPNLRQEEGDRGNMEWVYDVWVKGHLEKRKLYGGKLLENISQGLAGELCKESMARMGEDVVGQCHDELLVICKKGLAQMTASKLKRAMSVAPSWMPNMMLDAEVKIGSNWGIK